MLDLGWQPYQNDHEDANGQFEMNWNYDDALVTRRPARVLQVHDALDRREARHARNVHAEAVRRPDGLGLPTPTCRSGADGVNVFADPEGELGVSRTGYHFIGGLIHSAGAMAAVTNPTVNSYKRINAPMDTVGARPGRPTP